MFRKKKFLIQEVIDRIIYDSSNEDLNILGYDHDQDFESEKDSDIILVD